mgnify:CR=1 FL=1
MIEKTQIPRRDFIKNTAIVASAVAVSTLLVEGCAEEKKEGPKKWPEGKLNIAVIGVGMGFGNMGRCMDENIVALCDVDRERMKGRIEAFNDSKVLAR